MNRIISRLGLTAVAIVAGGGVIAHAQTATTGQIQGVVRDDKGNPLAGALVTLSSSQITRTTTTAADGTYRIGLLNAGTWRVKASKNGQTAPAQTINVSMNNVTTLNLKLASEAAAEVTVVGTASTLDPTTTQTGATLQMDTIKSIPTGRDFNTLVALAPGTQGGGLMGGSSISGSSAIENNFIIDGLDTTDYRLGFQGSTMPTDFIDQVSVQTGGFAPEYSALGGVVNAVTKSGSNQFAGSVWFTNDMAQMAGRPERNFYHQQTPANYRYDYGFTAGGAFIPDKLFYFIGFNQVKTQSVPNTNELGLTDTPENNKYSNVYGKFNYFLTPNQQLTGTIQVTQNPIDQAHQYPASLGNRDFGYSSTQNTTNWSLNYDWTISPSLFLSAKYGASVSDSHTTPTSMAASISDYMWYQTGPGAADPTYGGKPYGTFIYYHGGSGDWNDTTDSNNQQARLDLSWFVGNHSVKFGISHNHADAHVIDYLNPSGDDRVTIGSKYVRVTQYANLGSKASLDYDAFYLQDQWEFSPGVRLLYGFREEYQKVKGNSGQTIFDFTNFMDQIQPRIGLTWDINNDGKSKLSANFAVYDERFPMQAALRSGGNETYKQYTFTYASGAATYDPVTGGYTHAPIGPAYQTANYSGLFLDDPQPLGGLKVPKREEILLGFDHTFDNGWTAGIHGHYRNLWRIIEDTVPTDANGNAIDGGVGASILWNPKYGKTYQWLNNQWYNGLATQFGLPTKPAGYVNTWMNNVFPNPENRYEAVDLTLDKKTDRWNFSANYTYGHLFGNYEGVGQTSNGQSDANITSTWDYAPYVGNGNLPLDRRHIAKAYGSYTWDLWEGKFTFGANLTYQSGTPRTYFDDGTATNGISQGNPGSLDWGYYGNAVPKDLIYGGQGFTPATKQADLHFSYTRAFMGGRLKLTPSIDIFNAGNTRTVVTYDDYGTTAAAAPNPAVGYANAWMPGRYVRWGVKATF